MRCQGDVGWGSAFFSFLSLVGLRLEGLMDCD